MIKDVIQDIVGIAGRHCSPVIRRVDQGLSIFVFHDVCDDPAPFTKENDITVSTKLFEYQIEFISEHFNVISPQSWLRGQVPARPAMITFDDGYKGTFESAIPVLNAKNLPSVIFLNMGPILGERFWSEQVIYLCRKVDSFQQFLVERNIATLTQLNQAHLKCTEEIISLYEETQGSGYLDAIPEYREAYADAKDLEAASHDKLVTFANHLFTHFNVQTLGDNNLKREFKKNEVQLLKYNNYLPLFAFPFGQPDTCFSMAQASFLLRIGATRLLTSWSRINLDHEAKMVDRIPLSTKHSKDHKLWFQILKYPIKELLGVHGLQYDINY